MLDRFKLPIALSLLGLVLIIGGVFTSGLNKQPKQYPKESLITADKVISVDVSGAVKNPGVYQLKDSSRMEKAIQMAGGFADNANQEFISKYLNLAQKLSDGSKVYVPTEGDPSTGSGQEGQSKVNINTASQAELEALPGIGQSTASKIISLRPFQTIEDLLAKKAVGKSVYEKIKDQLVLY